MKTMDIALGVGIFGAVAAGAYFLLKPPAAVAPAPPNPAAFPPDPGTTDNASPLATPPTAGINGFSLGIGAMRRQRFARNINR